MPSLRRCGAVSSALGWVAALAAASSATGCDLATAPEPPNAITAVDVAGHAQYFPIAAGKHSGLDCVACHAARETFTDFDCLSCHAAEATEPHHHGAPGYRYESRACLECHPAGEGMPPGAPEDCPADMPCHDEPPPTAAGAPDAAGEGA